MNNDHPAKDDLYDLPAGHAYLQPAMRVKIIAVKPNEWVAYANETNTGCSRYDYFIGSAVSVHQ